MDVGEVGETHVWKCSALLQQTKCAGGHRAALLCLVPLLANCVGLFNMPSLLMKRVFHGPVKE